MQRSMESELQQRFGIGFTGDGVGLFPANARKRQFEAMVVLDQEQPQRQQAFGFANPNGCQMLEQSHSQVVPNSIPAIMAMENKMNPTVLQESNNGPRKKGKSRSSTRSSIGKKERKKITRRARPASCTSKYRGVSWYRANNIWKSQITLNGRYEYLGYHEKEEDAAYAYDIRAYQVLGEEAELNFPERREETRKLALETIKEKGAFGTRQGETKATATPTDSKNHKEDDDEDRDDESHEDDADHDQTSTNDDDADADHSCSSLYETGPMNQESPEVPLMPSKKRSKSNSSESMTTCFSPSSSLSSPQEAFPRSTKGLSNQTIRLQEGMIRGTIVAKLGSNIPGLTIEKLAKDLGISMGELLLYISGQDLPNRVLLGERLLKGILDFESSQIHNEIASILGLIKSSIIQLQVTPLEIFQSSGLHPTTLTNIMNGILDGRGFALQLNKLLEYLLMRHRITNQIGAANHSVGLHYQATKEQNKQMY